VQYAIFLLKNTGLIKIIKKKFINSFLKPSLIKHRANKLETNVFLTRGFSNQGYFFEDSNSALKNLYSIYITIVMFFLGCAVCYFFIKEHGINKDYQEEL
jgi:hypothetical protein